VRILKDTLPDSVFVNILLPATQPSQDANKLDKNQPHIFAGKHSNSVKNLFFYEFFFNTKAANAKAKTNQST